MPAERGFNIHRLTLEPRALLAERDAAFDTAGPWALAFIAQDGGLHCHARTMGFGFA